MSTPAIPPPSRSKPAAVRIPRPSGAGWASLDAALRESEEMALRCSDRWDYVAAVGSDSVATVRPGSRK